MQPDLRRDLHAVGLDSGWEPVPGGAPGLQQKMLSNWLDEDAKVGCRTRLIRFPPGQTVPARFVHDYWEEVYILDGRLAIGVGEDGTTMETFGPASYACRPPGTPHGPFRSEAGCLFLEVQYYSGDAA
ncbi:cupin [Methylobacterium terricola]|uniref:Cupin n=1 Tax=Methylobacterium terricola TaxID=2583531 RepID=A0A5C4LFD6_9HYPH|nr:cupin domain-containing protein [Methylobacterium terricola]TNC11611.1 cupin [Methylobacterium terricola]